METQTRDADATRARILDAATRLFIEHGFAAVSMRRLAEASDVTKSLIHHHFGNKEQLWEEVKETAFQTYARKQQEMLETAEQSDAELLVSSVRAYFSFLRENPGVVRLFAWTHLEEDQTCGRSDRDLVALGARRIREAQEQGLLRADVNPTHVVTLFVNACTHWFEARSHHSEWEGIGTDDEYLEDFIRILMEGLTPRKD